MLVYSSLLLFLLLLLMVVVCGISFTSCCHLPFRIVQKIASNLSSPTSHYPSTSFCATGCKSFYLYVWYNDKITSPMTPMGIFQIPFIRNFFSQFCFPFIDAFHQITMHVWERIYFYVHTYPTLFWFSWSVTRSVRKKNMLVLQSFIETIK